MAVMEAYLPVEIINEILLRQPVKSLLRFRCVSKEWLSLISDSQFTTLHLSRSKKGKKSSLVTITEDDASIICTLIGEDHNSRFKVNDSPDHFGLQINLFVLSSCDGLLCYSLPESDSDVYFRFSIYLMNPATREIKSLPHLPNPFYRQVEFLTYKLVGLGFEPTSRDYKVVKIVYHPDSTRIYPQGYTRRNVSVYSLNSCNWRILEDIPALDINRIICSYVPSPVIVINGVAYWMLLSEKAYSFDLVHAVSRELPSLPGESYHRDLFVMGGNQLSVLCYDAQESSTGIELWVMKESGVQKSWIKHRIIYFYDWNHNVVQHHWDYELVRGQWNDDDDDGILFQHFSRLVLYSTKNNSQRDLGIHGLPTTGSTAICLTESLVKLVD